jgi:hypothetical protein
MFKKFKKWILGGTILMAVIGWLYKLYKSHIENEVRKKELKKKAKELEKESADTIYKANKIKSEIDNIDAVINRKKEGLKNAEEKAKDRIKASELPEDKKLEMFNDLFGK